MPTLIPACGRTLHLAGVCVNRIGTQRTCSSRIGKTNLFLLVLGETTPIDLKRVHEKIGAQGRVSFGSAELLEEVWGVRPGAVTPFGAINDEAGKVRVVLDETMMRHERLNFHPLINTRTTGLASADLLKFLRATGHEPLVVALGQDRPPVE